jgi:arachidonate 15-lipoxygenase
LVKVGDSWCLDNFDYLAEVVSLIIYTASAQHASVNYAQYPLMSYVPSVPGALYSTPPTASDTIRKQDYLKWLPPLDVALYQLSFSYLLSGIQYDRLGYYSDNPRVPYFTDPRVEPLVAAFQGELSLAELTIRKRNQLRPYPYLLQLPSMVPNSISI